MTKKRSQSQSANLSRDPRSIIIGIISVIIIVLAALFGIDLADVGVEPTPAPPTATATFAPPSNVTLGEVAAIPVQQGFGATSGFWQVYFTAPTGSRDTSTYVGGIDVPLASAIDQVRSTLDIAAFEFNSRVLTDAVIAAHRRGVRVRMVVDTEHALEDATSTMSEIVAAGIPVEDDRRSAFMHNKFMILDGGVVWMGSTNYTVNDVYRNNNNMLVLRSQRAVSAYQAEFNEMFEQRDFGQRTSEQNAITFTQDGVPIQIIFSPDGDPVRAIIQTLQRAQRSIRFMTFSFTLSEIGAVLLERAAAGVDVQGIFETRGSLTASSQLTPLFCSGMPVFQDGNPNTFHHKVFIVDDAIVITGSFNISANATQRNDENLVIIEEPNLAAQYVAEYERVRAQARIPEGVTCGN